MEAMVRSTSTDSQSLSEKVLLTIADAEGVDPLDLSPRLYDVVDPEALESIFCHEQRARASNLSITFDYLDWEVRVHDGGEVTLTESTEADDSSYR